ncbi:MAG: hypothetical protein EZS28_040404 [Streblomastix strix]|uniref:Uncharacterized protein n=1 Tax=Streblomastix strix TaxID=222440 RepID=A0A5J4U1N1_9EUKA|nr:MAG: hypothetical protein EZS28_040404 [Streblomastix strix]
MIKDSQTQNNEAQLKQRIANFGPVLSASNGASETRLYYGWDGTEFLCTYRNDIKITSQTPREDCECPPADDESAFKADPRSKNKNGLCYVEPPEHIPPIVTASGATRAAWTVIAAVLLLPLLLMWRSFLQGHQ